MIGPRPAPLSIRVAPDLLKRVDLHAKAKNLSRHAAVIDLLVRGLKKKDAPL